MNMLKQSVNLPDLPSRSSVQLKAPPVRLVLLLLALGLTACHALPKPDVSAREAGPLPPHPGGPLFDEAGYEKLVTEKAALQREVDRLQKLLAEKEAHIRNQEVRHQDQAKTLQETSSQAAHAQVKLRRLATRPAAASTIAEVEMLMQNLKLSPAVGSEQVLQTQAQRLLDAATAAYAEDNFGAAMDYAAQARGLIGMIANNRARKASDPLQAIVSFQVPMPFRVIADSNLRQKPGLGAAVLGTLKKDSTMIADAYRGDWLQVLTADGRSGWVFCELVEAQIVNPRRNGNIID